MSDDTRQDAATTSEHSKLIIELFQNRTLLFSDMINIWENTDGCEEQYLCATVPYLLSIFAHAYKIIFDCGVGAPVHGREVVDGINSNENNFFQF